MANNVNRPAHDSEDKIEFENTAARGDVSSASRVTRETAADDHSNQEAWIGTDSTKIQRGNVSWGAIFAGALTFVAIAFLLSLGAAAMGLQSAGGVAVGIWTIIGLILAFLAAGYVAGSLGVRAGLFHGFLTWAMSLLSILLLAGWLGGSALGLIGNIAGGAVNTAAQTISVTPQDAENAANEAQQQAQGVSQEQIDQAQRQANEAAQQASETAQRVAPQVGAGAWWTFGGLLLGAVISSLAGTMGARSVLNKREETVVATAPSTKARR